MSTGLVLGSASVSWRVEIRRQRGLKWVYCVMRYEQLPRLGQCGVQRA